MILKSSIEAATASCNTGSCGSSDSIGICGSSGRTGSTGSGRAPFKLSHKNIQTASPKFNLSIDFFFETFFESVEFFYLGTPGI